MKSRNLSEKDVLAAAKTYVPPGGRDEFIMFSSTGQAGADPRLRRPVDAPPQIYRRVHARALPGLRLRQRIEEAVHGENAEGETITWGDTHHPDISKTNGDYDGQYLFINDKNTPRIAVIGLKDFETRQIVVNPVLTNEHGGAFVTNNSEYVMEASQLPAPLGREVCAARQIQRRLSRRHHLLEIQP